QPQGVLDAGQGVVEPALHQQRLPQVVVSLGPVRLEPQRLAVARRRLVEPTQDLQRHAEVVVEFDVARLSCDGPADQLDGLAVTAGLVGQYAQQVQGGGAVRLALDELTTESFRLRKAAGLESLDCLCECRHGSMGSQWKFESAGSLAVSSLWAVRRFVAKVPRDYLNSPLS